MEPKQIYLTRREPSYAAEAWGERWRRHGRFVRNLPLWSQIRHYEQCRVLDAQAAAATGMADGLDLAQDGVGMVWFRSPEAVHAALADPTVGSVFEDEKDVFAAPIADHSVFTREVVVRRTGATTLKLIAFVRRRDGMSREEFSRYWEHEHGPLFLSLPEISAHVTTYVQNHVLDEFTGVMGERFDGVAEIGFARPQDVAPTFAGDYMAVIRPDEERFLQMDAMTVVLTDETLLYEDALGPMD